MIPIVASLLGSLAQNGLGLLSSAIQAKGKEVVENALGVKIPDNPTAEDVSKLRELQFAHEERLLELGIEKAKMELAEMEMYAKAAQSDAENITDRWQADMNSDSWLSKNIRPMSLIAIFSGYFLFAMMSAFNSGGFSVGTAADYNTNAATYVGWQWNAGGSTVTNTSGSISAQVRANTTAGFSVVTYTGNGVTAATVGHGLSAIPAMVIIKERGTAGTNWMVKHQSLASSNNLFLQGTNATTNITSAVSGGGIANLSSSTTFNFLAGTVNTDNVNRNTGTFVAYCFAQVAGYSAFGSYTGNGSADGPFVFTGFRPRWVMIKNASDGTRSWYVYDSSRNTYNVAGAYLLPNSSGAESSTAAMDFLSNGFKIRESATYANGSGNTIIYACFAENPFKYANAR